MNIDLKHARQSMLVALLVGCVTDESAPQESRVAPSAQAGQAKSNTGLEDAGESKVVSSAGDSWLPLAADVGVADKDLAAWAVAWGRWIYSQTSCADPSFDEDGSQCGLYDDRASPMFFLASGEPGTTRTRCEVPVDKHVFVPLISAIWDNAGLPEEQQLADQELAAGVTEIADTFSGLTLRVDGVDVEDLSSHIVVAREFAYTVPSPPNWYSCNGYPEVTGTVSPAFVSGVFVVLPPPAAGEHVLEYGGTMYVYAQKTVNEVNTTLHVRP